MYNLLFDILTSGGLRPQQSKIIASHVAQQNVFVSVCSCVKPTGLGRYHKLGQRASQIYITLCGLGGQ